MKFVKVGTNFVPLTPTIFVFYNSSLVVFIILFTHVLFAVLLPFTSFYSSFLSLSLFWWWNLGEAGWGGGWEVSPLQVTGELPTTCTKCLRHLQKKEFDRNL